MDFKKMVEEVAEDLETEVQKKLKAQIKSLLLQKRNAKELLDNLDRELIDLELKYTQGSSTTPEGEGYEA